MSRPNHAIECWIREPMAVRQWQLESILDRLRRLDQHGLIESLRIETWGMRLVRPTGDGGPPGHSPARVRNRLTAIQRWAESRSVRLGPGFRTATVGSIVSEVRAAALELPVITLLLTTDGSIDLVVPCETADGVYSVPDCVADLEAGTSFPDPIRAEAMTATDQTPGLSGMRSP